MIRMVTASGEEHGLINTKPNFVEARGDSHLDPKIKSEYEKKRKHDAKMVKARYINHRGMNERLDKVYCKYAGDPLQCYHLIPGYTYELPLGFIEEVNSVRMPQRSGLQMVDGKEIRSDASPLDKDKEGIAIHELVATSFF